MIERIDPRSPLREFVDWFCKNLDAGSIKSDMRLCDARLGWHQHVQVIQMAESGSSSHGVSRLGDVEI